MTKLNQNILLFISQRFLHDFLLIAPVLIPFYQYNQLGGFAFYLSQAVYALTVFVMEVPSGYLADVIGRRKTLIIGAFLAPIGFVIYALSSSFPLFLTAEFIMAVGNSMRSGSDSALLYDSLKALSREDEYARVEGRGHQFARMSTGIASISGGLLAAVALRLPFYINILISLAIIPVTWAMTEPERKKASGENPLQNILRIAAQSLKNPDIRPFILYIGLIGSVSIISLWAYFLYYQSIGIPLALFGVLFAAFQFSGAFGARLSARMAEKFGPVRLLMGSLLIFPILVMTGLMRSPWLLILIMLHPFIWNLTIPVLLQQINLRTAAQVRATVLSLANMGVSFGYVLIGPVFGRLSDRMPLRFCFLFLSVLYLLFSLLLLAQIRRHWQARHKYGLAAADQNIQQDEMSD